MPEFFHELITTPVSDFGQMVVTPHHTGTFGISDTISDAGIMELETFVHRSVESAASFAAVEASQIGFTKLRRSQPEAARFVLERLEQLPEFVEEQMVPLALGAWKTALQWMPGLRRISASHTVSICNRAENDMMILQGRPSPLDDFFRLSPQLLPLKSMLQDARASKDPKLQLICAVWYKAVLGVFWQAARLSPKFSPANLHAYEIRVSLDDVKPEIWRTFRVSGAIRLSQLHDALQIVMGWENCHLHSFHLDGIEFGMTLDGEEIDEPAFLDEKEFRLEELAHGEAAILQYQYDFGDSWQHTLDIRAVAESPDPKAHPVCTGGERGCPPEDCGGAHGYAELLQTLADPANPEFDDMWNWAGRDFEPERFDPAAVNRLLKRRFK